MGACGFYGKVVSRGDFVTRRLPRSFVEPWDAWLQAGLAASRGALGNDWLDRYLTSPIWRFALGPGCCGPDAVAGVVLPSVDRVGRYFPFTLAAVLDADTALAALARDAAPWFAHAEALALHALEDSLDLEAYDTGVAALPAPQVTQTLRLREAPAVRTLSDVDEAGAVAATLAREALPPDWHGAALWWTQGSQHVAPCLLLGSELPPASGFHALLDGSWADAGFGGGPTA